MAMEFVSNCFTKAAQCVTSFVQSATASFVQRATKFVSNLWVGQNNQTDEGEQNSLEVANAVLGVSSPNAGRGIDMQALLTEGKEVANWVTSISAGGIFSLVSGVLGNEKAVLQHEYFFTAFMILSYVSFVSALALHLLVRKSPETRGFVKIVKFTIYFSQGTLVYAINCAVCLMFPSKFGVVFILVVPPVPFGLIVILSSARWGKGSIP